MNYRPDIDGLRALAVIGVVLNHAGLGLSGGYVGVDVFFVISGYLIASLMLNDLDAGTFSLAHFWERRIRRIVPALVVVVAASFLAGWFILVPKAYELFGRSVVSVVAIRSNEFFGRHTDYFAPAAEEKPLLHTWSLAVEEQFYLIAPLLFWGAMRLRRRAWLSPLVVVLGVASFVWAIWSTSRSGGSAYYQLGTRAWEPLAGVLTALLCRRVIIWPRAVREIAAATGLAAIVWACFACDAKTPFPGLATLPPVMGAVLLIVAGHAVGTVAPPENARLSHDSASGSPSPTASVVQRLLASRWAVGIGLISYSLYLWHWPVLAFTKAAGIALVSVAERVLPVLASLSLAWLTYLYVEQPFRKRRLLSERRPLFAMAAVALGCLVVAGQTLRWTDGMATRLPDAARRFVATHPQEEQYNRNHFAADVPRGLLRIGEPGKSPRILVWGDSHAMAVLPALDDACRAAGVAAECALGYSRPPVIRHSTQSNDRDRLDSDAFGQAVIEHVRRSDHEVVLLAAIWHSYFGSPQFPDALIETVGELRDAGKQVYFLRHIPSFDVNVGPRLVYDAWHGHDLMKYALPMERYAAQCRPYEGLQAALVEQGVRVLDPLPYFRVRSADGRIAPFDQGGSLYHDGGHLSAYGARVIGPIFDPVIAEAAHGPLTAEKGREPAADGGTTIRR
jgi:peptidoglycan/LPS O-acetylase OafA/YrhL